MQALDGIVGRDAELAAVEAALDGLGEGAPGVLQITGEPGIGKTRLLDALREMAEDRDRLVLSGLAAEFERAVPFAMLLDSLDAYLAAAQAREIDRWAGPHVEELAAIFPSLAELAEGGEPQLPDERYRAHFAVRGLLEGLAATRPLVLVLDDLQWADDASTELVASLVRRPPDAAVLIALAFRSGGEPAPVASARRAAEHGGWLTRLEPGALKPGDAEALIDSEVREEDRELLVEEAGGNPFYLTELSQAAAKGGASSARPVAASESPGGVPAPVAAALEAELDGLEPASLELLRAAAIAGEPFEPDLAALIAEIGDDESLRLLDDLLTTGVVRPTDVPRQFLFRHPLVRRAVYEGAPGGWRIAAHGRAAAILEERGAAPAARAHHVEQSARVGDNDAVALLQAAAASVAGRAPGSAARWLEAALRLIPAGDAERRAGLLAPLAMSQASLGHLEASVEAIGELLELLPAEATEIRLRLVAGLAAMRNLMGEHAAALGILEATLDSLGEGRPEAAALEIELAFNAFWSSDYAAAIRRGERAVETARRGEDSMLTATAHAVLAFALALAGETEPAERSRAEARAMIDASDDAQAGMRLEAFGHLGWAENLLGRYEESIDHLERGKTLARATGQGQHLSLLDAAQIASLTTVGSFARARESSLATIALGRLNNNDQALAYGLSSICRLAAFEGRLDEAGEAARELEELTRGELGTATGVYAAFSLAEFQLQTGEPDRAIELLEAGCGGPDLPLIPAGRRPDYLEIRCRAELEGGRADVADLVATEAEATAARLGFPHAKALAHRARAEVQLAAGDAAAAAAAALESAGDAERSGAALDAARSRLLAGRALAAAGDRDAALAELTRAEAELAEIGADRLRGHAARELRRLGRRVRARAAQTPGGPEAHGLSALTAREREIAELVTDRKTNREIADELVLSEKTIESHLRNVFAKLGVSKRAELARVVESER